MGFRSTLVSEDSLTVTWPAWFREKYAYLLPDDRDVLRTAWETKTHHYDELPNDIWSVLTELDWFKADPSNDKPGRSFVYVWLHECGGITRVQINAAKVRIAYPIEWEVWDGEDQNSIHYYCYGCTDTSKWDAEEQARIVEAERVKRQAKIAALPVLPPMPGHWSSDSTTPPG